MARSSEQEPLASPRRPRVAGDRESDILDATVEVLAEVGYDRLTMDSVAAAAHASKATLYRRWSSKGELVVDAVARAKRLPDNETPDTGSLREDLLSRSCGSHGWTGSLPMAVLAGLITALQTDEDLAKAWRRTVLVPAQDATRELFERAQQRGDIPPNANLELLVALLPAMCTYRCFVAGRLVDEDFVRAVIDDVVLPAARRTCSSRAGR